MGLKWKRNFAPPPPHTSLMLTGSELCCCFKTLIRATKPHVSMESGSPSSMITRGEEKNDCMHGSWWINIRPHLDYIQSIKEGGPAGLQEEDQDRLEHNN